MNKITGILIMCMMLTSCMSKAGENNEYRVKGKLLTDAQSFTSCGVTQVEVVLKFTVLKISGIKYSNDKMAIAVICPDMYGKDFFKKGGVYDIVVSKENHLRSDYNRKLLTMNKLPFEPFAKSIEKLN